ncbi:hypothetical protein GCM10023325_02740 [Sphingomonas lutea]
MPPPTPPSTPPNKLNPLFTIGAQPRAMAKVILLLMAVWAVADELVAPPPEPPMLIDASR